MNRHSTPSSHPTTVAELIGASKKFKSGSRTITALQKTDLALHTKELIIIIGPSGSGKTTLLSLIGCVLYPTEGRIYIKERDTRDLNDRKLAQLRRQEIGFVFQNFNLIAPLNTEENIRIPLSLNRVPMKETKKLTEQALSLVGLTDRRHFLPKQLSGGEQQRVAIARALVANPDIILCDEPTASLDSDSLKVIMQELRKLADTGKAVAVVTHDPRLESYADRIIRIDNGKIEEKL